LNYLKLKINYVFCIRLGKYIIDNLDQVIAYGLIKAEKRRSRERRSKEPGSKEHGSKEHGSKERVSKECRSKEQRSK
jgi:hypothetical protein